MVYTHSHKKKKKKSNFSIVFYLRPGEQKEFRNISHCNENVPLGILKTRKTLSLSLEKRINLKLKIPVAVADCTADGQRRGKNHVARTVNRGVYIENGV